MSDVLIDVSQRVSQIHIGYQGENKATNVVFDISSWIDEYGDGEAVLHILRNGEKQPYAKGCTISGTDATWVVDDVDTAHAGRGMAQLVYKVNNVTKKNAIYTTVVGNGVENPDDGYDPDVYEAYLDKMAEYYDMVAESAAQAEAAIAGIEAAAQSATSAAATASSASTAAATSVSNASASEQNAAQSATTASNAASAASASEVNAAASETVATTSANSAATSATNAAISETNAATSETNAAASETAAATSATSANESAESAEAWAVGKVDGVDVDSTHDAYQNNAKYYAEQAGTSATTAEAAKTSAQSSATTATNAASSVQEYSGTAEAWAVGQIDGVDVDSSHDTYHNNSKYYAEQAATSATTATDAADFVEDIVAAYTDGSIADVQVNGSSVVRSGIAYVNLAEYSNVVEAYPISGATELSASWLSKTSGGTALTPASDTIYILVADSTTYTVNQQFRWNGSSYITLADSTTAIETTFIDSLIAQ